MSVMVPQRGDASEIAERNERNNASASVSNAVAKAKTHKVRRGETLYAIATKYGVSVGDLKASNNLGSRGTIRIGQTLKIGNASITTASNSNEAKPEKRWVTYKVRKGETLGKIADAFDVSVSELRSWNPKAKRAVKQGQSLKVYSDVEYAADEDSRSVKAQKGDMATKSKSKVTYRVKRGDTLSSIARKYGTTTSKLKSANGISGSSLKSGQRLTIPQ